MMYGQDWPGQGCVDAEGSAGEDLKLLTERLLPTFYFH
jgi:hypothetical protein